MYLKMCAAAVSVVLGAATGYEMRRRLSARASLFGSLGNMCRQMLSLIESQGVPLGAIAERLSLQYEIMRICADRMNDGESFCCAFRCGADALRELREEEKLCLYQLADSLGRCSEHSQKRIIDAAIGQLAEYEEAAKTEKSEKSRLYLSGGVLAGAFAAVLML